ncbi:vacuolar sorting protein 3 [Heracleum sosnowskyi]|uniref:Vacuolar sorting protein 3 n=1 Tax=Heracleum sosnowskyi TaxID=360622 RepID=A0AAD8MBH8_9APIA|nr:vacuolar sorting protein 3 [Heracleum sosnowskyi]
MAKPDPPNSTTIIEPFAEFKGPSTSSPSSQIKSLAISSLSDHQTLIYAGTISGNLLLLSLDSNQITDSKLKNVKLIKYVKVSTGPIESIHVIEEVKRVLVVSEGFLYFVDLNFVEAVKKLSSLKGVSVVGKRVKSGGSEFTELEELEKTGGSRLLRKLGNFRSNGGSGKEGGVLDVERSCVFAVVCGKVLMLIGYDSSESVVVLKEMQCLEMVKTIVWVDDCIVVGNFSGYYLYSCVTGKCDLLFTLPDPISSPPRIKLLRKEWKLLLLVDNVGVSVDSQGQPVGGSLVFRNAPDSVGEMGRYVIVVKNGEMDLYHKKSGCRMQTVSLAGEGIGPIVADDQDGNSALVAVAIHNKVICYGKVPSEEQIKDLLRRKNYKEAISLAEELQGEGEITDEMMSFVHAQVGYLLLFDLHFEEAIDHFLLSDTLHPSEVFPFIMREPNRWSLLVPRNRYWGLHPPPTVLENVIDEGLVAIQRAIFLKKAGVESGLDDKFLLNPPNRSDLLELAIRNMIRFLQGSRRKDPNPSVREGMDTLLMYLYRAVNCVDEMERLASSENSCFVEELETLLNDSGQLRTLAFLYASKGMSSKALAIWRILARNYSSEYWRESTGINDVQDATRLVLSGKDAAAIEASRILEELSDQDLVLQHLGWIADTDQQLAVRVLTSDKRTDQLSPEEVIAAIDPKKVEILESYLQWLIEDQDSEDTQFHTSYALLLAKSAVETSDTERAVENSKAETIEEIDTTDSGRLSLLQSSVRERLQIFLQSSDLYDPEEVLDLIEGSELWLEKAILYRKLGQETLVLQILALKLEDSEAAEQYCAEIGRPDAYMQLLDMYLNPNDGKEPMFRAAVRLLHNHGDSLDPMQVLERLSPDMPLQLASETILRMLRARIHHQNQGQIVHNLSHAVDVDASLARFEERSRHVQITEETLCDSCHSRLGTKLFAMYPDDTVVCYKCFRRQGESTSVTGRNFRQDIIFKSGWLVTR